MRYFLLLLSLWLGVGCVTDTYAQTVNEQQYRLHIKKAKGKIVLDGVLDEADWQAAEATTPFRQQFPYDTSLAVQQSQARLTFDDKFLYLSFVVQQPRHYTVLSLKRDFPQGGGTDLIVVNFDTFKDKQNAFHFAVSPYGVQREALVANGNEVSNDWDNKWYTEVTNYDDHWVVESAIPFKTLRYKLSEGINEWNVNFFRNNLLINERSAWAQIPRGFPGNSIAFSGTLVWDDAPPKPGINISVIPYVSASTAKDYLNGKPSVNQTGLGLDAKIAVTPSLNLDLTVNPDFSQVEVDRQQTNLSRFELFFPERRQFFLENNDLFGTFGRSNINPFFSRRIGIAYNANTQQNEGVRITAGARLSGKITNNWRIGLLNMQTARRDEADIPAVNYSVAVVQRKVFTLSTVGLIMVNRQEFLKEGQLDHRNFHRVVGIDYNMNTKNGLWSNKVFYHRAFTSGNQRGQDAAALDLNLQSPTWALESTNQYIGQNYSAAVGFVPRQNLLRNATFASYSFYPKNPAINKVLNSWGFGVDWDLYVRRTDGLITDWDGTPLIFFMRFQNNASFRFTPFRNDYTYLFSDFDPTNTGGKKLKTGTSYHYQSLRLLYQSNNNKPFYWTLQGRFGEYFNGKINALTVGSNYRIMPYALFSLDINYNQIKLPTGYNSATLWLISPRAEVTFSKSVFLTTFLQYNNQANNVNLNARFQWRFKPVSDLFVVYTDNYFATTPEGLPQANTLGWLGSKSRALVFKLTYWLNM
jgi:hypothetical protein